MSAPAVVRKKPAAHIPNLKTLRRSLGQSDDCPLGGSFLHAVISFRTLHSNHRGVPYTKFRKWRIDEHREERFAMTHTFPAARGNGELFRLEDMSSPHYNPRLQYHAYHKEYVNFL